MLRIGFEPNVLVQQVLDGPLGLLQSLGREFLPLHVEPLGGDRFEGAGQRDLLCLALTSSDPWMAPPAGVEGFDFKADFGSLRRSMEARYPYRYPW
jgi:hypothetical protein